MKTQPDQAWNDAADAMLTDLRGRGLGNSEIARKMGRGKASIAHRCAKLIAAGKLPRRQSWRAWTTAEIRQAERLLRDGLSWKDTARRLNRTQDALYKIAQLHALQIQRGRTCRTNARRSSVWRAKGTRRAPSRRRWDVQCAAFETSCSGKKSDERRNKVIDARYGVP